MKWRGIDAGDIKCRGSEEEPAFIAARINLSFMLTQGKIMQLLNAALAAHSCGSCSCSDGVVTGSKGGSQQSFQTETDTRTDYTKCSLSKFEEQKWFVFTQLSIKRIWKEPIPGSICLVKLSLKRRSCRSHGRTQITKRRRKHPNSEIIFKWTQEYNQQKVEDSIQQQQWRNEDAQRSLRMGTQIDRS